jgi:hypothetical protein
MRLLRRVEQLVSPAKPLVVIRNAPPLASDLPPDPPSPEYPVRLTFLLAGHGPGVAEPTQGR